METKEIVVKQDAQIIAREKIVKALDMFGLQKAPEAVKEQFIEVCQGMNLNPFLREVYAVPFGGSFQIVVGYQIYLKRAEATGVLNGWSCEYLEKPNRVKITIHRKDWQHPFVYEAFEAEFKKSSPLWIKMPRLMMSKCAMSAAFRICFPMAFVGMPYTVEELDVEPKKNDVAEDLPKQDTYTPEPSLPKGNPEQAMLQIDKAQTEGELLHYKKIIIEERSWTKDELTWLLERIDKRIAEFKNKLLVEVFK